MKQLPEYYKVAMGYAMEAVDTIGRPSSRLPDINTPHGYLMRSSCSRRDGGGYWVTWRCFREDGGFAGMGAIGAADLSIMLVRTRGAFNRQYNGRTSLRHLRLLAKKIKR